MIKVMIFVVFVTLDIFYLMENVFRPTHSDIHKQKLTVSNVNQVLMALEINILNVPNIVRHVLDPRLLTAKLVLMVMLWSNTFFLIFIFNKIFKSNFNFFNYKQLLSFERLV